jgi:hypothetical protein
MRIQRVSVITNFVYNYTLKVNITMKQQQKNK